MTHRVVALVVAALIAASACPARKSAGRREAAIPQHDAPAQPASRPAAPDRSVADAGRPGAPSTPAPASPQAAAQPGTQAPSPGAADPAGAPPATASAYVFSPQQAATAPAGAASAPATSPKGTQATGTAPAETPPAPGAPPAPERSPEAPRGSLQLVVVASAPVIATGGVVTVDVMASSDTAVVDAPLHLSFDPRVVAFVDGTPGDFLTQGGSSVVFFADGVSRPGDVAIAAGRVERTFGTIGSGLLCRVRFRGVATGTSPVVVGQAKAWGTRGDELPVASSGTSVVVR